LRIAYLQVLLIVLTSEKQIVFKHYAIKRQRKPAITIVWITSKMHFIFVRRQNKRIEKDHLKNGLSLFRGLVKKEE
jgi:hypothetical protein